MVDERFDQEIEQAWTSKRLATLRAIASRSGGMTGMPCLVQQ
jgi:hypothetical protein